MATVIAHTADLTISPARHGGFVVRSMGYNISSDRFDALGGNILFAGTLPDALEFIRVGLADTVFLGPLNASQSPGRTQ